MNALLSLPKKSCQVNLRPSKFVRFRAFSGGVLFDAVSSWVRITSPRSGYEIGSDCSAKTIFVASLFARANGISAGAELQIDALSDIGRRATSIDITSAIRNPFARADDSLPKSPDVVIIHTDGRMAAIPLHYLRGRLGNAFRVGYCAWELPDPPRGWGRFDRALDEVWAPSEFTKLSLEKMCQCPVRVVRHVVRPPIHLETESMRSRLGLSHSDFVVLCMADVRSSLARKNPIGAIETFKRALGHRKDAVLVLKVSGASHDPAVFEALRAETVGFRVIFFTDRLSVQDQWAMYGACDVFLSLHRAEGYGLPMAEAMAAGRAVIATAWSGNMDFMTQETAAMVDYDLVGISDPQGVYSGSYWAEPRIDHAVDWLERLYVDATLRSEISTSAKACMAHDRQLAEFKSQLPSFLR